MLLALQSSADSDIVKLMPHTLWECSYRIAIARGKPSSFETAHWDYAQQIDSQSTLQAGVRQLRSVALQMLTKIRV